MKSGLLLLSLSVCVGPLLAEQLIYSNTTNDLGTSLNPVQPVGNLVAAGSHITFAGTARYLTTAQFQIWNSAATDVNSTATLSLYNIDTLTNTLGSLIGSYTLAAANYGANTLPTLTFSLPGLIAAPNDIVWALAFSDNALQLNYYDPPTLGQSTGFDAWWDTGSGLTRYTFPAGGENYNAAFSAELTPAPEPAFYVAVTLGLAGLFLARRQKRAAELPHN